MLKVAFVIPDLSTGGVETNFLRLINSLPSDSITSSVIYQNETDNQVYRSKFDSKINFFKLNSSNTFNFLKSIKNYFNKINPDIIVVSMYGVAFLIIIARLLSDHKPKIIVNGSGHFSSIIAHMPRLKERLFLRIGARATLHLADFFVSQCQAMTDDLMQYTSLPNEKISVINNPIITEDYQKIIRAPLSHKWLNEKDRNYKIIIMAGRLVPQKGVLEFLEIFKKLAKRNLNIKLIILGEGELQETIKKKIQDLNLSNIVDLLPNQENYPSFIAACDLFVVNSIYEGLNNMIVESLACGTSVVSTDCPVGPSEVLVNGKFGRLVQLGNEGQMIKMIEEELKSLSRNKELLKGRAEDFKVEKATFAYVKLFNKITSTRT
ncbi:glycosyltransferase [Pseudomonadota bacterium]|nr:glycosyltransferase [Pseudomonadota bacterium]